MIKKTIFTMVAVIFLQACITETEQISAIPMLGKDIVESFGEPPYKLVTYNNEDVSLQIIQIQNGDLSSTLKAVYVNELSQFVFSNGERIKNNSGNYLYWNNQGYIINNKVKKILKSSVFIVNDKPLSDSVPLKLKGFVPLYSNDQL